MGKAPAFLYGTHSRSNAPFFKAKERWWPNHYKTGFYDLFCNRFVYIYIQIALNFGTRR